MDDAETTCQSSVFFQILTAANGKARLPIVDSLKEVIAIGYHRIANPHCKKFRLRNDLYCVGWGV